jgi:hypothetical protein
MILLGDKGKEAFGKHWRSVWLAQVQNIQPFFEEGSDYLVFLQEMGGGCNENQFHISCFLLGKDSNRFVIFLLFDLVNRFFRRYF